MSKNEIKDLFESFYDGMEKSLNEEEVMVDLNEFLKESKGEELVVELLRMELSKKGTLLGVDMRVINTDGWYTDYYLERKIA